MTYSLYRKRFFKRLQAQNANAGIEPSVVTGEVVSASTDKIICRPKDGVMDVVLSGKTEYKSRSARKSELKAAVASSFTDIGESATSFLLLEYFLPTKRAFRQKASIYRTSPTSLKDN